MLIGATLLLGFGLSSKPDTNLQAWANEQALKELKEEGKL